MNDLKTISTQIQQALNSEINPQNKAQVAFKINRLTLVLAASCHAVAWAERLYSRRMQELTENKAFSKVPAADKKVLFAGYSREEAYYLTLTDRQNKALIHTLEVLRSLVH